MFRGDDGDVPSRAGRNTAEIRFVFAPSAVKPLRAEFPSLPHTPSFPSLALFGTTSPVFAPPAHQGRKKLALFGRIRYPAPRSLPIGFGAVGRASPLAPDCHASPAPELALFVQHALCARPTCSQNWLCFAQWTLRSGTGPRNWLCLLPLGDLTLSRTSCFGFRPPLFRGGIYDSLFSCMIIVHLRWFCVK